MDEEGLEMLKQPSPRGRPAEARVGNSPERPSVAVPAPLGREESDGDVHAAAAAASSRSWQRYVDVLPARLRGCVPELLRASRAAEMEREVKHGRMMRSLGFHVYHKATVASEGASEDCLLTNSGRDKGRAGAAGKLRAEFEVKQQPSRLFLYPDTHFQGWWNVLIISLVIYNAFSLPLLLAFRPPQNVVWLTVDYLIDALFIVDVLVKFNTGYINRNRELVVDKRLIRERYIRGWFTVDFLSSVPLELFVLPFLPRSGEGLNLLSGLKSFRLLRLGRAIKYLQRFKFSSLWRIMRLYVFIIIFSHWVACAWFYLSWAQPPPFAGGETWAEAAGIAVPPGGGRADADLSTQYWTSVVAALEMLFRGSATRPETNAERVFYVLAILLGACLHAIIFGQVAHLVASMNSAAAKYQLKMQDLYERMRYHRLPRSVQSRIALYYEDLWKRHRIVEGEDDILGFTKHLSAPLRLEVNLFLNRDMLEKVPMFQDCDANVIVEVVGFLKSQLYLKGDCVVRAGELGDKMYFLRSGRCEVFVLPHDGDHGSHVDGHTDSRAAASSSRRRYKLVNTLKEGEYFGEIALLFKTKRAATVQAATFCDIASISQEDFATILENHSEFAERISAGLLKYSEPSDGGELAPHIRRIIEDRDDDLRRRAGAAGSLSPIASDSKEALPAMFPVSPSLSPSPPLRTSSADLFVPSDVFEERLAALEERLTDAMSQQTLLLTRLLAKAGISDDNEEEEADAGVAEEDGDSAEEAA